MRKTRVNRQMKSRKKVPPKSLVLGLISAERCESLLISWVNLHNESSACLKLLRDYNDVFQSVLPISSAALFSCRRLLRKTWEAPDARHRDYYLSVLRIYFQHHVNARAAGADVDTLSHQALAGDTEAERRLQALLEPGLTDTTLEAALFYLQTRAGSRIRCCPNPDCSAKYFLKSPTNPKQTSCSPDCADVVRRARKRQWWTDNRSKGARG